MDETIPVVAIVEQRCDLIPILQQFGLIFFPVTSLAFLFFECAHLFLCHSCIVRLHLALFALSGCRHTQVPALESVASSLLRTTLSIISKIDSLHVVIRVKGRIKHIARQLTFSLHLILNSCLLITLNAARLIDSARLCGCH